MRAPHAFLCLWTFTQMHSVRVLSCRVGAGTPAMHFSCLSPCLGVRGCLVNYEPWHGERAQQTHLDFKTSGFLGCSLRFAKEDQSLTGFG